MNKIKFLLGIIALTLAGTASAADFDGSKPMLCALVDVYECTPDKGCHLVSAESVNAPTFLRIDAKKKVLTGSAPGEERPPSKVSNRESINGKLVLQGADDGVEGVREDGLAWSVAIDEDSGKFVLSASGSDVAFTAFGACAIP